MPIHNLNGMMISMSTCCRCGVVLDKEEKLARPEAPVCADCRPAWEATHPEPPAIDRHSPEKIIEILRSITKLEITKIGELDIWFDQEFPESVNSFVPGSFTRELLELIESHLVGE
jgi:hypothetical protein